jgi:hypothetical protein
MTFMATAYCKGTATSVGTPVAEGIVAADPKLLPIGAVRFGRRSVGVTVLRQRN